jgi:hypothetical protein
MIFFYICRCIQTYLYWDSLCSLDRKSVKCRILPSVRNPAVEVLFFTRLILLVGSFSLFFPSFFVFLTFCLVYKLTMHLLNHILGSNLQIVLNPVD